MTYKQDFNQENDIDAFWRSYYVANPRKETSYKKCFIFLFLILITFTSYDSFSAECVYPRDRYYQENIQRNVVIHYADGEALETCLDDVLLTSIEYAVLVEKSTSTSTQGLENLLVTLFAFDSEVFAIVEIALILAFLTSHFAGRVVRWLGK